MRPFVPRFTNSHLLTLAGSYWPRTLDVSRFPVEDRYYRTDADTQVLARVQRPAGEPRGEIILLHGLEGSSEGGYMRSMAQAALEAGFAVQRLNLRSCGGTEHLCKTLYNAGLTADLRAILEQLGYPVWLAGYSLGGNVVLKLAGELGAAAAGRIRGVCAVSTPIDLAACTTALEKRENGLYQWQFVRRMKQRMRDRHRAMPDLFPLDGLDGIRSLREFDDRITGPFFGFRDAAHYYSVQSANRFLDGIQVPALILSAEDDPLVPFEIYSHPSIKANPHIELCAVEHGGHLGFIGRGKPAFWLDGVLLEWIRKTGNI